MVRDEFQIMIVLKIQLMLQISPIFRPHFFHFHRQSSFWTCHLNPWPSILDSMCKLDRYVMMSGNWLYFYKSEFVTARSKGPLGKSWTIMNDETFKRDSLDSQASLLRNQRRLSRIERDHMGLKLFDDQE